MWEKRSHWRHDFHKAMPTMNEILFPKQHAIPQNDSPHSLHPELNILAWFDFHIQTPWWGTFLHDLNQINFVSCKKIQSWNKQYFYSLVENFDWIKLCLMLLCIFIVPVYRTLSWMTSWACEKILKSVWIHATTYTHNSPAPQTARSATTW